MPSAAATRRTPLDDVLLRTPARGIGLLALDKALDSLSRIDARKGRVVELRYFGGLSVEEPAEFLRISPETVKRDWKWRRPGCLASSPGGRSGVSGIQIARTQIKHFW
jgi:DNA-directed RNA polymerase specialized sigma24 family protein